jgi:CheY-like chemotaxis protein
MMPKLDGLSVCRNLRAAANSAGPHRLHRLVQRSPAASLSQGTYTTRGSR